ncbi:MAG: prenyltransferase [Alphaproteobacteria bacterium]|nr:prenyltransferase [Alphaproteobacteria bacterium]
MTIENSEISFFKGSLDRIISLQRKDGSITWFENGIFDPWNHLESVMALNIFQYEEEKEIGFKYLKETQLDDGSWYGQLGSDVEIDLDDGKFKGDEINEKTIRDTNFSAYIATACWHDYLINQSLDFLEEMWPTIENAISFVLRHQSSNGEVRWAAKDASAPLDDALITGCCSIYKSLECAINCASALGIKKVDWEKSLIHLRDAIKNKPELFDRTWESKDRFSMDWYYPILSGVISGDEAKERLNKKWDIFVIENIGCKCVSDQPWVTVAETAELAIALLKMGREKDAKQMLSWSHKCRDDDDVYWMGKQYEQNVFWPAEKPPWTSASVILAYDAIFKISRGSELFLIDGLRNSL